MSDEFLDRNGRDWRTPMPLTGKPVLKTYYDWAYCGWRTEVCILLGAREEAPGTPWSETAAGRGKGKPPTLPRMELHREERKPRSERGALSMRDQIRSFLRSVAEASTHEIATALGEGMTSRLVAGVISGDSMIERVAGKAGSGRRIAEEQSRWALKGRQR